MGGPFPSDVISSISLLKGLKNLGICWNGGLADVLQSIGQNLVSMEIWNLTAEVWQATCDCPNLKYLNLTIFSVDSGINPDILATLNGGLKKRLKKLASFRVEGSPVRLGTDWAGY
jgi:hypothetical protein